MNNLPIDGEILAIRPEAWAAFLESFAHAKAGIMTFQRPTMAAQQDDRDRDIIRISGTLLPVMPAWAKGFLNATGYDEIEEQILAALQNGKPEILLSIDSPGGYTRGIDAVLSAIDKARETKTVTARVDGYACSAAYWIASRAHEISATRTSMIGSVGTVVVQYDVSKNYEKHGVEAVVTRSGPLKAGGIIGEQITEEMRAETQKLVDGLTAIFVGDVMRGRSLTDIEQVRTGGVYLAQEALALGLIDSVAAIGAAANKSQEPKMVTENTSVAANSDQAATVDAGAIERARCKDILAAFKDAPEFAAAAIDRGLTVAEAKAERYDVLQARAQAVASLGVAPIAKAPVDAAEPVAETPVDFLSLASAKADKLGIPLFEACEKLSREKPELWKNYQLARTEALAGKKE